MKPIKLTMQAFGSYGEKTVIDFTAPNQKLFLITGDTGAGKTTIFDAMVYALYDQVSSSKADKKGGLDLQSHFANRYVTPFVEFEFSELHNGQEDTYTIYRSPEHYSKKNATTTKKKVRLVMPDGKDFPSNNAKEINAKIMEILGLTKEQFMQVGMIAQGEFMQMLRSKSDEKKAIFRKLFGTELFERIIAELNERNKSAQQELKELLLDCQKRVDDIRLPKDLPEGNPLPALKAKLADKKEKPNIADLEDLARELKLLTAEQQKQLEEINAACKATASQRDEINALAAKAQELAKAYGQLDKVLAQEKDCQGQQAQRIPQGIARVAHPDHQAPGVDRERQASDDAPVSVSPEEKDAHVIHDHEYHGNDLQESGPLVSPGPVSTITAIGYTIKHIHRQTSSFTFCRARSYLRIHDIRIIAFLFPARNTLDVTALPLV